MTLPNTLPVYTKVGSDELGREEHTHEFRDYSFFEGKTLQGIGWPENKKIIVKRVAEEESSFIADEYIDEKLTGEFAYSFHTAGWKVIE